MNPGTEPSASGAAAREHILLPCAESCAAYRPLQPDQWSDFGLCTNPRSPFCGHPVRPGRECRHFLPTGPKPVAAA